jgi:hypothetical protein
VMIRPRTRFIRRAAVDLLERCRITEPPVDLRIIADNLCIAYEEVDYFPDDVDSLIIPIEDRVVAVVNLNHSSVRRRFSLAHEICHYLHHKDRSVLQEVPTIDSPPTSDDLRKDPYEVEADVFAGELLVPLPMLKTAYRAGQTAADIARAFDVSEAVASIAITTHFNAIFK